MSAQPNAVAISSPTHRSIAMTEADDADDETARECQAYFRERLQLEAPNIYLVPPDIGSQLYEWWQNKRRKRASPSPRRQARSLPAQARLRQSTEHEGIHDEITEPSRSLRQKKRAHDPFQANENHPKRSRRSSTASSTTTDVESVFSLTERKLDSASSEAAHSTRQSAQPSPRPDSFKSGKRFPSPPHRSVTRPNFPFLEDSPKDDAFLDTLHAASRTRPTTFPSAWEKAHPADKMLFSQGRADRSWQIIADRWKEMTRHSDNISHLKWRFEIIQKSMGLQHLGDLGEGDDLEMSPAVNLEVESSHGWAERLSRMAQTAELDQDLLGHESAVEMAFEAKHNRAGLNQPSRPRKKRRGIPSGTDVNRRNYIEQYLSDRAKGTKAQKPATPLGRTEAKVFSTEQSLGRDYNEIRWESVSLPLQNTGT